MPHRIVKHTADVRLFVEAETSLLTNTKVSGKLIGGKVDQFEEDVKAVTYHEAEVKKNEKGNWETTLVLDI